MLAHVIYPKSNDPEINIHEPKYRENLVFEYDTKKGQGVAIEEILEEIWEAFNIYSEDCVNKIPYKNKVRSMMVGDIVHFPNIDKYYVVASIGFKEFSKEEVEAWYEVPERDRHFHNLLRT